MIHVDDKVIQSGDKLIALITNTHLTASFQAQPG